MEIKSEKYCQIKELKPGLMHLRTLENDEALPDDQRKEYSYPFLLSANGNDAHLVYTCDRKKIRHVYLPAPWLANAFNQLPRPSESGSNTFGQEVQQ